MTKTERAAWKRGVEAAADVVSQFNSVSGHAFRLDDVILCKLNVTTRKSARKNTDSDKEFLKGYGIALAAMIRDHGDLGGARRILRGDNINLKRLLKCGLDEFDTDHLKKLAS